MDQVDADQEENGKADSGDELELAAARLRRPVSRWHHTTSYRFRCDSPWYVQVARRLRQYPGVWKAPRSPRIRQLS
jgi:hypothetical protein